MPVLYTLLLATLASNGALIVLLMWAHGSPRFAEKRIRAGMEMRVTRRHRVLVMVTTSVLSLAIVLGVPYLLHDFLLHERPVPAYLVALQAVAVLLVYDFVYYFAHRAMHHKKLFSWVHGVHHRARNPSAIESFYQHPAELFVGLSLLFGATYVVGPVHVYAFAAAFAVYSTLNILVHSGLEFRTPLLRPIDFLTRKHHTHHLEDARKNFSSLTPLPDLVFRSSR